jgi:hypothetical protein
MCEPISIGLAIGAMSMALSAVKSKMTNDAAKADYYGKVQASQAAALQGTRDRENTDARLVSERAAAERKVTGNQMEATLKAEELRGKALAQGANGSVASAAGVDQQDRMFYLGAEGVRTAGIHYLEENKRSLTSKAKEAYDKQMAQLWQNRPGAAPVNTTGIDLTVGALNATKAGFNAYGSAVDAGIGSTA